MSVLYVVNHGTETHTDRFDGVDYVFEPETPVKVPVYAAQLFFGYGNDNKTEAFVRSGRMSNTAQYDQCMEWLGNFQFSMMEEKPVTLEDLQEERAPKRRRGAAVEE